MIDMRPPQQPPKVPIRQFSKRNLCRRGSEVRVLARGSSEEVGVRLLGWGLDGIGQPSAALIFVLQVNNFLA